jgi:hypothetical protein
VFAAIETDESVEDRVDDVERGETVRGSIDEGEGCVGERETMRLLGVSERGERSIRIRLGGNSKCEVSEIVCTEVAKSERRSRVNKHVRRVALRVSRGKWFEGSIFERNPRGGLQNDDATYRVSAKRHKQKAEVRPKDR